MSKKKEYTCTKCHQVKEGEPAKEWFNLGEWMEWQERLRRGEKNIKSPFNKVCKDCPGG